MKRAIGIVVLAFLCAWNFGCQPNSDIKRVKTDYGSNSYFFHPESRLISYIRGCLPNSTYLTILDPSNKKSKSYHFNDYSFLGAHEIIPELNVSLAAVANIRAGMFNKQLLLIDLSKGKIIKTFDLPPDYVATLIYKPKWTEKVFILLQIEDGGAKTILKSIDLNDYAETESIVIGNFVGKTALIHDTKPLLIIDAVENNQNKLIVYDMNNKRINADYITETYFADLKINDDKIYGLIQLPTDNRGQIRRYELDQKKENIISEIDGISESMVIIKNIIYTIEKDRKRSDLQKKYWLHPRNLCLYNLTNIAEKKVLNWTQRKGSLFGFDDKTDNIFFAVLDNDEPSIWLIHNDENTLSKIEKIIK